MHWNNAVCAALAVSLAAASVAKAEPVPASAANDPLRSGMWGYMLESLFEGEDVVFDDAVVVKAPASAEDNMNVPVTFDATGLGQKVERVVVFTEANPIVKVLEFEPLAAEPFLGFAVKLQQGGPVRAAALTEDGVWRVGGVYVDAAGGGCTAPASVHAEDDWVDRLGEMHARAWPQAGGPTRVKVRLYHPMDTGLADGIPAFYLERLEISAEDGEALARISPLEPVAQHPMFTLMLGTPEGAEALEVSGRDNEGDLFAGRIPLPPAPAGSGA